jgi:hypothetical protein
MAKKDRSDTEDADLNAKFGEASGADDRESAEVRARREARRRVLAGGLASAPLILTLGSRPALGGGGHHGGGYKKCGYSGLMSGNLSHDHVDNSRWCKGKEPSYWKMKEDDCNRYFVVGPTNPLYIDNWECDDYSIATEEDLNEYREKLAKDPWRNWYKIRKVDEYLEWLERYPGLDSPPFGTPFAEIFGDGIADDPQLTLMQALWLDESSPYPPSDNGGPNPLIAHIAAAYCNACEFGKESFGYTPDGIVEKVRSEFHLDPIALEEHLRLINEQG